MVTLESPEWIRNILNTKKKKKPFKSQGIDSIRDMEVK